MTSMFDRVLSDLQRNFPGKILLSPTEIAPIIAASPKVQANMRSQGRFPIPVRKTGAKVGVSIYHLAEFIATGQVEQDAGAEGPAIAEESDLPLRRPRSITKRDREWLLALQTQATFQFELIIAIKHEFLKAVLPAKAGKPERKRLKL